MTDLQLIDGDLNINASTLDLNYFIKEEDNISANLIRRVKTLKNQYSISYYDYSDLTFKIIGLDYGSNIYSYLSQPTNILAYQALRELKLSLEQETRIRVINVNMVSPNNYSMTYLVDYYYKDEFYSLSI